MKKIRIIFLLFLLVLLSCKVQKSKTQQPEDVLLKFLQHLQRLEFEEAKRFGTESTVQMLNIMQSMVALMPQSPPPVEGEIIIYRCDVDDIHATCYIRMNQRDQTMRMTKIEGKWLVDLKKEDFQSPRLNIQLPDNKQ